MCMCMYMYTTDNNNKNINKHMYICGHVITHEHLFQVARPLRQRTLYLHARHRSGEGQGRGRACWTMPALVKPRDRNNRYSAQTRG